MLKVKWNEDMGRTVTTERKPVSKGIERFIDKITQQYARMTIHNTIKEKGFEVEDEWEMDNGSIELTVTRWVASP